MDFPIPGTREFGTMREGVPRTVLDAPDAEPFPPGILPARVYGDQRIDPVQAGRHFWLQAVDMPLAVPAGGTAQTQLIAPSEDAFFITSWTAIIIVQATNIVNSLLPVFVQMEDLQENRSYQQPEEFLPVRAIFGTGNFPGFLPLPLVIPRMGAWSLLFNNLHTLPVNIRITAQCRRKLPFANTEGQ